MHGGEERVCPYCDGKGYVPVEGTRENGTDLCDTRTWVRKDCPLCGGTGRLYGGADSSESKDSD